MLYVLQYPNFTTYDLATSMCDRDGSIKNSQLYGWLMYGKLGESITLTPLYDQVYSTPAAKNRYIQDVTVEPIPSGVASVTLAAGATFTITNPLSKSATSSNTAYATATVVDGILTIKAVATGTATVKVFDKNQDLMYTITVTIS